MTALVQTIVQTRPSSSPGTSTFTSPAQTSQSPISRAHTMSLSTYNATSGSTGYRNPQAMPVAPYAFTSTPGLVHSFNGQQRQPTPSQQGLQNGNPPRLPPFAAGSVSSSSSSYSSHQSYVSQDDSVLSSRRRTGEISPRPLSTVILPSQSGSFTLPHSPSGSAKPSPDRYRRGNRRADHLAGTQPGPTPSGLNPPMPIPVRASSYDSSTPTAPAPSPQDIPLPPGPRSLMQGHARVSSADDTRPQKSQHPENATRYRRKTWSSSLDVAGLLDSNQQLPSKSLFTPLPELKIPELKMPAEPPRPRSAHSRSGSTDSIHSSRSSTTSSERDPSTTLRPTSSKEESKNSTKVSRTPSPLSNQVTVRMGPQSTTAAPIGDGNGESPAAQRLADISKSSTKKSGKSRLRRAFSFGSAAELRKLSLQNAIGKREVVDSDQGERNDELDPEQAAIAAQQEANGLGENIYSNQGNIFSGSTDNLSISSTASSASVMLRKMGRGMKRSTRSLVGLFRPKSIVSTSETAVVEPMAPQVSVVNVEAERKTVVANPDAHDQRGGGTLFPKIENISPAVPEMERPAVEIARKSIIGGETERAEVLAAVRKGILKRAGSSSPTIRPADSRPFELSPPQGSHSHANDSPNSSAPSTPDDHAPRTGHRRTDTVKIEGEDYFLSSKLGGSESKSTPVTPHPVVSKSIVFSPRIQFHETWPSGEYDRRGEAATCNRLTPLLAQQIKEELNTFKMEMEVHETSKVYTHFL